MMKKILILLCCWFVPILCSNPEKSSVEMQNNQNYLAHEWPNPVGGLSTSPLSIRASAPIVPENVSIAVEERKNNANKTINDILNRHYLQRKRDKQCSNCCRFWCIIGAVFGTTFAIIEIVRFASSSNTTEINPDVYNSSSTGAYNFTQTNIPTDLDRPQFKPLRRRLSKK